MRQQKSLFDEDSESIHKQNNSDTLAKFPTIEDMMFGNKNAIHKDKQKKAARANPSFYYRNVNKRRK